MRILPVSAAVNHAVRSAYDNLAMSFHLCWPWLVVLGGLDVALIWLSGAGTAVPQQANGEVALAIYFSIVLTLFAGSSIAVNWHRFILKDEVPQGLARLRADAVVWRYFGNTVLIVLLAMLTILPGIMALSLLGAVIGLTVNAAGVAIAVVMMAAIMPLIYRWSLKLPAIALERNDYGLKQAWLDSQGNHSRLMIIGVGYLIAMLALGLLAQTVGSLLQGAVGSAAIVIEIFLRLAMNWLGTILAATVLTSLYGFFVEKRSF